MAALQELQQDEKTLLLLKPRGFCAGVVRAIDIVRIALEAFGPPIYVRKEIVHNRFVVEELQGKVFDAIHVDHQPLFAPGDPLQTQREQLQFAKDNGISEADFNKAYSAFAVQTGLSEADDLGRRYRIDAVPTFVIAGKYETDLSMAGGESNLFHIINDLSANEKHH